MQSQSEFGGREAQPLYSYGMHFCSNCQNLMRPHTFSGQMLDFLCDKCNKKQAIDYSRRKGEDTLLYSKQLQAGARKVVLDRDYIFDPTMPSVDIKCPQCGYGRAVYMLTPDEGETKLVVRMICASATGTVAKCEHTWILEDEAELTRTRVISEEEKFFGFE